MKKSFLIPLFVLAMVGTIIACSEIEDCENENNKSNILIAYFTMPEANGVDASSGASRLIKNGVLVGSTQYIAQVIQEEIKGDTFVIKTIYQYPASHDSLLAQAVEEQKKSARPLLATHIKNIDQYDIIFLGYPTWCGDLPMPIYSFLQEYNFVGKTIIPFNSSGGSGLVNTVEAIRRLHSEATVVKALTIPRDSISESKENIKKWLKEINMLK